MRGCALRKVVRNLAHKNWKTGASNPSTSLHRSRDQRRPGGLRWAGGWQKNRAPREAQGRQVKNCRSHVDRQRRHRPVLVGGVHRCGTWPASASATASAASIDAAPGQHRYRHRQGQNPRPGACFGMAGVGTSVVDFHRCGTWPASASASAASLDAAPGQHRYRHRQEPSTQRMPWHSRRWRRHRRLPPGGGRWALGIVRLHAVVSGQPPLRRGVGRLSVLISVRSMRPIQPPL